MILVPEFILKDIDDPYIRENFKRLNLFFQKDTLLKGSWKFFELDLKAGSEQLIAHGLGFKPLDVILTSKIGAGTPTFEFEKFTATHLCISVASGPCTIRFFVGAYREDN